MNLRSSSILPFVDFPPSPGITAKFLGQSYVHWTETTRNSDDSETTTTYTSQVTFESLAQKSSVGLSKQSSYAGNLLQPLCPSVHRRGEGRSYTGGSTQLPLQFHPASEASLFFRGGHWKGEAALKSFSGIVKVILLGMQIRYWVKVKVDRVKAFNRSRIHIFTVVGIVDLNTMPQLRVCIYSPFSNT